MNESSEKDWLEGAHVVAAEIDWLELAKAKVASLQEKGPMPMQTEEITATVVKKPPPASASPLQMHQTVQSLRVIFRKLSLPKESPAVEAALVDLEMMISTRTSKEKRLQAFHALRNVINEEAKHRSQIFQQAQKLIQTLPTAPNLPVTDTDNIVRAIVAILRSNGALNE